MGSIGNESPHSLGCHYPRSHSSSGHSSEDSSSEDTSSVESLSQNSGHSMPDGVARSSKHLNENDVDARDGDAGIVNGTGEEGHIIDRRTDCKRNDHTMHDPASPGPCNTGQREHGSEQTGRPKPHESRLKRASRRKTPAAPPPVPSLAEVLDGKIKLDEVVEAVEIDPVVEQEQLEEELLELDLSGVEALAYVLTSKLGSLKKAFKWFDSNRKRKIARCAWDLGMVLLRIDMERLTGLKPIQIFKLMDREHQGLVTRTDWIEFFRKLEEGDMAGLLRNRDRKKRGKRRENRKLASGNQDGRSDEDDNSSDDPPSPSGASARSNMSRRGARGSVTGGSRNPYSPAGDGGSPRSQCRLRGNGGKHESGSESESQDDIDKDGNPIRRRCRKAGKSGPNGRVPGDSVCVAVGDAVGGAVGGAIGGAVGFGGPAVGQNHRGCALMGGSVCGNVGSASALAALDSFSKTGGTLPPAEAQDFRDKVRRELSELARYECLEYPAELGAEKCGIVLDVAAELELWSHVQGEPASQSPNDTVRMGACVLVGNMRDFVQETEQNLLTICTGDCLEFPSSLTEAQRRVVHILAARRGLWTRSEGKGRCRRAIAFNVGNFAEEIRVLLELLGPGESRAFPSRFTATQRKIVHAVATELGLFSHVQQKDGEESHVEVFNCVDVAEDLRATLLSLADGEQRDWACELGEREREVIHVLAAELDLAALSQGGEGDQNCVSVANLQGFRAAVRIELEVLQPCECKAYPFELTALQRMVVQEVALELGLRSRSVSCPDGRCYVEAAKVGTADSWSCVRPIDDGSPLSRRMALDASEDGSESKASDSGDDEDFSLASRLFEAYATGWHSGSKVFLRFPDLTEFVEDMKTLMPAQYKLFKKLLPQMECLFDDTVQLQTDMGVRTSNGLKIQYFQVYIQKVLLKLGYATVSLLRAILDEID